MELKFKLSEENQNEVIKAVNDFFKSQTKIYKGTTEIPSDFDENGFVAEYTTAEVYEPYNGSCDVHWIKNNARENQKFDTYESNLMLLIKDDFSDDNISLYKEDEIIIKDDVMIVNCTNIALDGRCVVFFYHKNYTENEAVKVIKSSLITSLLESFCDMIPNSNPVELIVKLEDLLFDKINKSKINLDDKYISLDIKFNENIDIYFNRIDIKSGLFRKGFIIRSDDVFCSFNSYYEIIDRLMEFKNL